MYPVLLDEGAESAVTERQAVAAFVGIDLPRETATDATALLEFRRLLRKKGLTKTLFDTINRALSAKGLIMPEGIISDSTILAAAPSVNNGAKVRYPERIRQ